MRRKFIYVNILFVINQLTDWLSTAAVPFNKTLTGTLKTNK